MTGRTVSDVSIGATKLDDADLLFIAALAVMLRVSLSDIMSLALNSIVLMHPLAIVSGILVCRLWVVHTFVAFE